MSYWKHRGLILLAAAILTAVLIHAAPARGQDGIPMVKSDPWMTFDLPEYFEIPGTCLPDSANPIPDDWTWNWADVFYRNTVGSNTSWNSLSVIWERVVRNPATGRLGIQVFVGNYGLYEGYVVLSDNFGASSCPSDTTQIMVSKRKPGRARGAQWQGTAP